MRTFPTAAALLAAALLTGCASLGDGDSGASADAAAADSAPAAVPAEVLAATGECDDPARIFRVDFVNDGDTLTTVGGDRVRLLGVDTPELSTDDCLAFEALDYARSVLREDTLVCLSGDEAADDRDDFGRALRYAYVQRGGGWALVNALILRGGFGRVFEGFVRGLRHESAFRAQQGEARAAGAGGWGRCGW